MRDIQRQQSTTQHRVDTGRETHKMKERRKKRRKIISKDVKIN